ncbi:uncharacterized protein G2W53_039401 [Senna tora]|uniref:Uncharacterized protein n=1 Tax=Senna tora TaxID=362788 RepID=A0A834SQN6_9FABA|nr:uncharacterized protein G2W53_039401 [Senna tora]
MKKKAKLEKKSGKFTSLGPNREQRTEKIRNANGNAATSLNGDPLQLRAPAVVPVGCDGIPQATRTLPSNEVVAPLRSEMSIADLGRESGE